MFEYFERIEIVLTDEQKKFLDYNKAQLQLMSLRTVNVVAIIFIIVVHNCYKPKLCQYNTKFDWLLCQLRFTGYYLHSLYFLNCIFNISKVEDTLFESVLCIHNVHAYLLPQKRYCTSYR